ncbi:hypothetical protein KGQ20_24350 [Catenulispora sp. NF23]|uniref:Uncharacterized protein n=1 Tax=Catenulispora pinistramenti TaxID=2705254 RepID=A0ABS5KWE9_9ACTN|nr:hypothetical protein [Catenulispora pinistramenti]MBS2535899.1 hypothetical protein [Catenulispora pinistramenti]MBS2550406.1 hypothetical protein [Catenulispora pinistramenti]
MGVITPELRNQIEMETLVCADEASDIYAYACGTGIADLDHAPLADPNVVHAEVVLDMVDRGWVGECELLFTDAGWEASRRRWAALREAEAAAG